MSRSVGFLYHIETSHYFINLVFYEFCIILLKLVKYKYEKIDYDHSPFM